MRGLLHTEGEIVTTGTERLRVEVKSTIPGELHMHYAAPIIQCATGRIRNQVEKTLRSGRSPQEKKKFPYGGIQSGGAMVTTGSRAPVRPRYISSQAMPAYPSSSTRLSLSGGGGGSDDGNGSDGPPEKKELELYPP
ncbi:MAG TPA: hypothetical protein VI588_00295, partial [Candidatus Gracilibacteria bacterium]|nr:hypothetical protein [Candidatus Gracilibacteria bacterium]